MAGKRVLLDTGPLVALFKRNDAHHAQAVAWFKAFRGELVTTHAVLTEAWHLTGDAARLPLVRFAHAACSLPTLDHAFNSRIEAVLSRYADLPMDYADATLVALAETLDINQVATIDVNDFSVYRINGRKRFQLVFPPSE